MGVDISINQWNTCIAANDQSQSSKMNESQQLTFSDLGWRHILIATNNNVNVYVYETMKTIWVCPVCIWTKHIFRANKSWYFHIHISIVYVFRSMEKHIKSNCEWTSTNVQGHPEMRFQVFSVLWIHFINEFTG